MHLLVSVFDMSTKYAHLAMDWIDALNSKKSDQILRPWADGFVIHAGASLGEINDPASLTALIEGFWNAVPDLHVVIEDLVSDGDRVAIRTRSTGTHRGEFAGSAGTGNQVSFPAYAILKGTDDGIAEEWVLDDLLTFLIQIEAVPANIVMAGHEARH